MFIFNMRMGHACNSSSSHSVVIMSPEKLAKMSLSDDYEDYYGGAELGWDIFTLASDQAKMGYIVHMLRQQIAAKPGNSEAENTFLSMMLENYAEPMKVESIDHESVMVIPRSSSGSYHPEFLKQLFDFFSREDVCIIGGNDNEVVDEKAGFGPEELGTLCFDGEDSVVRKDTDGEVEWWTVFNKKTGNKVRFSFDNPVRVSYYDNGLVDNNPIVTPRKSLTPELVDMKITDYCAFEKDCGFCYMNSGKDGEHGKLYKIEQYLSGLGNMGVFEVALGGGETTLHPDFIEILKYGHTQGLNMNFTTKNFAWFRQKNRKQWREEVGKYTSAIAFSVNNPIDLGRMEKLLEEGVFQDMDDTEITVQCIPAILSKSMFKKIVLLSQKYHIRLTLLGFKRTGRGREFETKKQNSAWINTLAQMLNDDEISSWYVNSMAVDTVMAADCTEQFDQMGVSPVWYHTEEGAFSCFIDAVKNRLAASSFCSETYEFPTYFGNCVEDTILEFYHQMQSEQLM